MAAGKSKSAVLAVGGLAAILASACCLGPLVLLALGLSGAWIGNLAKLEPYRPYSLAAALVALLLAWRRIYRPAVECAPATFAPSRKTTICIKFCSGLSQCLC